MAVGSRAQHLLVTKKSFNHCAIQPCKRFRSCSTRFSQHLPTIHRFNNFKDRQICYRSLSTSDVLYVRPKLTPAEVNTILRANEFSKEFSDGGSVKSYDSNQLASNNPVEDTRSEVSCMLTTGMMFGVFDGHAGPSCSHVISKRLLHYIAACLLPPPVLSKYLTYLENNEEPKILEVHNNQGDLVDELKKLYEVSFRTFVNELSEIKTQHEFRMKEAIEKAFLRLDDDISKEALDTSNGDTNIKTLMVAMSGAVACVAHVDGPHLHVASVGDCQCVLGVLSDMNTWTTKKMNTEHNVDNLSEVNRIQGEHPSSEINTVIRMDRLLGQLAPFRALGDHRYKWSRKILEERVIRHFGDNVIPPNYHTPPYLSACPEVTYHHLTPRDKFLIIATDGLWDLMSPLQVVRLVGEHMSGKVTLNSFKLPRKDMRISDINRLLLQRMEGLQKKPMDSNVATHLIRNALGGTEYGIDHTKLSEILSLPDSSVRFFRDDITITVVYFDSEYLRHRPP